MKNLTHNSRCDGRDAQINKRTNKEMLLVSYEFPMHNITGCDSKNSCVPFMASITAWQTLFHSYTICHLERHTRTVTAHESMRTITQSLNVNS
jgi:hypothetical protein